MMGGPSAQLLTQIGIFVFVAVLAALLYPCLSRYQGNLAWVLSSDGAGPAAADWLFKHRQGPFRSKIGPIAGQRELFVNTGIGSVAEFKGSRTAAVYDPTPEKVG